MAENKVARNAAVVAMIKSKVPKVEIARLMGISAGRVRQIWDKHQWLEKKAAEVKIKQENRMRWKNICRGRLS